MRIQILSDLHLEMWGASTPVKGADADIVILAGDIAAGARACEWAFNTFAQPVLYVAGNHEAYGLDIGVTMAALETSQMVYANVHFLNMSTRTFENVRFIGATLWTDFCLYGEHRQHGHMRAAGKGMNDYYVISNGKDRLTPEDTLELHNQHRAFIAAELAKPFDGKTVVITHHLPSAKSIPVKYAGDPLNAAYASNLDDLVAQADVWIHGHTHDSFDYFIGKCRVVCNPCGYRHPGNHPENENFNPNFVIEV